MLQKFSTPEQMRAALCAARDELLSHCQEGTVNTLILPQVESCDPESASYVCSFSPRPEFANPGGKVLHGGLTGVLFDDAMGALASLYAGHMTPTISMTVSYLRPIPIDRPVFIRVHMNKPGSTVSYLSAEAFDPAQPGCALATASGTYYAQ